ncbi:hypothetical protein HN873_009952 [Arachis hypogaea]|uniref:F-box protein At3g26010-like beta-propeller domain-containing protein n=1 Tax=Arachis hypogaea TaxID=3818 RepID=A0A445DQ53_ARAHY|nr:hypothetical protein Ahy_A03g011246 [Arachis hypogaea]
MKNMEHNNFQGVRTTSRDSSVGLVCHYQFENGSSQFLFLDDAENGAVLNNSLSFFTENFVQSLASSNGLILLSGYSVDQPCYYVFNPLTKNSHLIPQASTLGRIIRIGLAYDGSQFEVVIVEAGSSSESNGLELHIFSSGTGCWSRKHLTNLTLPSLPEFEFQELGTPPLYSNGGIHWEIAGYLLVYQVKGSHCELFELPNLFDDWSWQSTMTYRRSLCESGGRVYYCYTDFDGFHIWDLLNEDDILGTYYACIDSKRFRWRLVQSIMHEVFISKYQIFYGRFIDWEPYKISPIGYSEQARSIYLQIPGTVVSYNFDTGIMRTICNYSYPGINFNCCKFLPLIASGVTNGTREVDLLPKEQMELNLPIAEMETLSL